ncbi:MAG: M14 family metallopeptidase [Limisphaerales bacterium]
MPRKKIKAMDRREKKAQRRPFPDIFAQRLGKNSGRYLGELIVLDDVLREIDEAARQHGWGSEIFFENERFKLKALHRSFPSRISHHISRIYISAGIHGDEPAGPLAARQLLRENIWPENLEIWICPCLNPSGFILNTRENLDGLDLNRQYLQPKSAETIAHIAWLEQQPNFDLTLLLHEDWESNGFYIYELNPNNLPTLAEKMVEAVAKVCPVDRSELIEGRSAQNGIIRPTDEVFARLDWPEAFYLIKHKTPLSYTLETPSDFSLTTRVKAQVAAVRAALDFFKH